MCQFPPPDDYFRPTLPPPRRSIRWTVIGLLAAILVAALLTGCGHLMPADPMMRPVLAPRTRQPPTITVYRQCDAKGCRLYDRKGERRYDCERAWSTCRIL